MAVFYEFYSSPPTMIVSHAIPLDERQAHVEHGLVVSCRRHAPFV